MSNLAFTCVCVDKTAIFFFFFFFKFITRDSVVDRGSYTRFLLKREKKEKKGKEREKEGVGDVIAIRDSK